MLIRRATPADAAAIFRCAAAAYGDYILLIGRTPGPLLEDYYEGILSQHTFVAVDEAGSLLGFILLKDDPADQTRMWLDALATNPEAAGRGLGRALIGHGEEYMKGRGVQLCYLYTHVKYERSIGIYQRFGYAIYQRVQEHGYDRYYLKKDLWQADADGKE